MRYSYSIIDKDREAVRSISRIMDQYHEFICVGTADNETDAVDLVLRKTPTLNFIDVEMPNDYNDVSAFGVLCELRKYMKELPQFIVVTKSPKYAIDAIKNDVLDYILKPIRPLDIRKAMYRFDKRMNAQADMLCIKSYGDYRFVNTDDILYLKADNNTTDFFMIGGQKISAYKTLKHFENKLPESFMRVHNSYIVNSKHVSRIHFGKAKFAIKDVAQWIPFSKSYKTNVETIKNSLFTANALCL